MLEPCKDSRVFKPPNPWLQAILALVAEIYAQDKLKLNLKFEIEMMFRNLNLQIGDAKPSLSLAKHKRQIINNADFTADKAMPPPQQAILEKQVSQLMHIFPWQCLEDSHWHRVLMVRVIECLLLRWLNLCFLVSLCFLACRSAYPLRMRFCVVSQR